MAKLKFVTSKKVPDNWVFEKAESFYKGFTVIGIITGRGTGP